MNELPADGEVRGVMGAGARPRIGPYLTLLLLWLSACSGRGESNVALRAAVHGPDGTLKTWAIALRTGDGVVWRGTCGQNETSDACDGGELLLPELGEDVTAVVKAPGYKTSHFPELHADGDELVRFDLEPLPAPTATADYRTGLEPDEGVEALLELGRSADTELGHTVSVKFLITEFQGESPVVHLQNTVKHPLHYDFASNVLGIHLSHLEFGQATYMGEDRSMCAGTLVYYPDLAIPETAWGNALTSPVTLNFFPSDNISVQLAARAARLVEERLATVVVAGTVDRLVYHPAGSQQELQLMSDPSPLAEYDLGYVRHGELYKGVELQLLNPGVAYGTLRLVTPEELEQSVASWTDILVLTRLPNQLPLVAGTITEELQTPLSHVNIAAHDRGTPNMALPGAAQDDRVAPLLGKLVRLEVSASKFTLGEVTLEEAEAFWDAHAKEPFEPAYDDEVTGLRSIADMGFADWTAFGVKCANLAELAQLLPNNAPEGFGVPFSYYREHLEQSLVTDSLCLAAKPDCIDEGRNPDDCEAAWQTCDDHVNNSIAGYIEALLADDKFATATTYRDAVLDGLVYLVGHAPVDAEFGATLDALVGELFGEAKVRLRSSTNAEDLENFSGAGLYNSVSAWSSGGDSAGNQIRKVWASVWTFRAFEERAYWQIDHTAVRMGVAVHRAFVNEAANGVLITQNIADPNVAGMYVNVQLGETSVTNPTNGATPEVFTMFQGPGGVIDVARQQYSSLSPKSAILSGTELATLYGLAMKAQQHFAALYNESPYGFALDIEFKVFGPERSIHLKQARPYSLAGP